MSCILFVPNSACLEHAFIADDSSSAVEASLHRLQEERRLQMLFKTEEEKLRRHDKQLAIQRLKRIEDGERRRQIDRIANDDKKLQELKARK